VDQEEHQDKQNVEEDTSKDVKGDAEEWKGENWEED